MTSDNKPLIATACFILSLLLIVFVVWPKYQELQDLNEKVAQQRINLEKSEKYISNLEDLDSRLKDHKGQLEKIEMALPSEAGLPSLLNFVYQTSKDTNLNFKRVGSISTPPSKEDVKRAEVNITLVGSYKAFRSFVRTIEESARVIDVKKASAEVPSRKEQANQEEEEPPTFDVQLIVNYYSP